MSLDESCEMEQYRLYFSLRGCRTLGNLIFFIPSLYNLIPSDIGGLNQYLTSFALPPVDS